MLLTTSVLFLYLLKLDGGSELLSMWLCGLVAGIISFHDFPHFVEEHKIIFLDLGFLFLLFLYGFAVM